jgi:hypothetical protein
MQLALGRTYASVNLIDGGVPEDIARCLANSLVHEFSQAQLVDTEFQQSAAFRERVAPLVEDCR